jgi:hypothetical protein
MFQMSYIQFEIRLHFTTTHCGSHQKKEQQSKVNLQVISTVFMRVLHLRASRSACYLHRAICLQLTVNIFIMTVFWSCCLSNSSTGNVVYKTEIFASINCVIRVEVRFVSTKWCQNRRLNTKGDSESLNWYACSPWTKRVETRLCSVVGTQIFRAITLKVAVIVYRRLGRTYRFHLQR